MRKNDYLLKGYLIFGASYLLLDALLHLFDLRLINVLSVWPVSALEYSRLLDHIYASFVILAALICFEMQRNLAKYKTLIYLSAIWALLHGFLLIFTSLNSNFSEVFKDHNSLGVWLPFYNLYLMFEASLLILYSIVVYLWQRPK